MLWSPWALFLCLAWLGLQAALYLLPARQVAEGQELKNKRRLLYPINGFQALVLTALLVGLGVLARLPLGALPEMLLPLAFSATLIAFVGSLLLYLKALVAPASALAPGGNSGNPVYDFSWDGSSTHASVPLTSNISANCGLASSAGSSSTWPC